MRSIFAIPSEEKFGHYRKYNLVIRSDAPLFQFEFEGRLFTLKQNTPQIAPLFTLPPRISPTGTPSRKIALATPDF